MQFVERVAALAKENGVTEKQVLLDCKLNKNLFGLWRQGRTPNTATKRVLADYFGVSVEYLMGKTDDRGQKNSPMPSDGTGDEMERYYALLSPENQAFVKSVIAEKLKEQLQGP